MQTVDREGFLMWLDGGLIRRSGTTCIVAPEKDCIATEEALAKGETIAMTKDGRIVSHVVPKDGGYYEEAI